MSYKKDTLIPHTNTGGERESLRPVILARLEDKVLIKKGIWIYFFLLIFEGALRKWLLPGLAAPLLIVRDPVALWIIGIALKKNIFPSNSLVKGMVFIGIFGTFTAVFFGHGNLAVALFGARIMLIHFPLIFIVGRSFDFEDVIKMGKIILWISIPMAGLVALQFYSPQSAWVNRGVGGDLAGAGFSGANGFFRPPATFSFITGTVSFFSLCATFIVYFWINRKGTNKIFLFAATAALIIVIPLSISRSLFFSVVLTIIFTGLAVARNSRFLGRMILGGIGVLLALAVISNTEAFKTGTGAFTSRFEQASADEGGVQNALIDRFFGGMITALKGSSEQPFFGLGLGLGTNVGSKITTGSTGFLVSEGEWGRVIGELGPLLGLLMIFYRLKLGFEVALASYKKMIRGNILPWLFLSIVLVTVPQGQWAQPSILGFSTLICGLAIAALKAPKTTQPIGGIRSVSNSHNNYNSL